MSVIFPKWTNVLPTAFAIGSLGGLCAVVGGFWYWATPKFFKVGYMPTQPESGFNHMLHAGKLGLDCRYCHTKVEKSPEANIPNVATCYGCHATAHVNLPSAQDAKTEFIRTKYAANESVAWRRIHKLPDYVRNFPHASHVKAGVSCYSCHGLILAMPVVHEAEPLGMGWCLTCHRGVTDSLQGKDNAAKYLVPHDKVTRLQFVQEQWMNDPAAHAGDARALLEAVHKAPPQNCGECHY